MRTPDAVRQRRARRRRRLGLHMVQVEVGEEAIELLEKRGYEPRRNDALNRARGDGAAIGSGPGRGLVPARSICSARRLMAVLRRQMFIDQVPHFCERLEFHHGWDGQGPRQRGRSAGCGRGVRSLPLSTALAPHSPTPDRLSAAERCPLASMQRRRWRSSASGQPCNQK